MTGRSGRVRQGVVGNKEMIMTQYRAGQTVEITGCVGNGPWAIGENITLERKIPENEAYAGEWDARGRDGSLGIIAEEDFQPVSEGPVRTETVTTRRIVPGVYGRLSVGQVVNAPDCNNPDEPPQVQVDLELIGGYGLTAAELDDLAMVASQLAEALRDA